MVSSPEHEHNVELLATTLRRSHSPMAVDVIMLDGSSLSNARRAAQEILVHTSIVRIDVLINTPMETPGPYTLTEDGIEKMLQKNYLTHFLLTNLILPKLLLAPAPRVVNVSSSANMISSMHWDDISFKTPNTYEQWTAYGQTKTANILFTYALNARLQSSSPPLHSYSVHPGGVRTKVQEQISAQSLKWAYEGTKKRFGEVIAKEFFTWKTLAAASSTPLLAALDPSLPGRKGVWLQDCELFSKSIHLAPWASNIEDALRLWKMSEDLVGEKF
jgi:NAD(P)-dependent dehydrogenase (short-subunit alcohol dehydrogenase family)